MKCIDLLLDTELPAGFVYPAQFKRVLKLGLHDLEPWYMLDGDALRVTSMGSVSDTRVDNWSLLRGVKIMTMSRTGMLSRRSGCRSARLLVKRQRVAWYV
jgi:hypothetical protein